MTIPVLWPTMRWPEAWHIEVEALGAGFSAEFCKAVPDVHERQWRACRAVVSQTDIPLCYLDMLDACRIFVTPKVGFDNINLKLWADRGIPVCNVPDYGTMEVADHAIAMMLDLLKGITFHTTELRENPRGHWRPALNPFGKRLSSATLGIVGLGRIGTATALRARAFGMRVVFYDPYVANGVDLALGVTRARTLAEIFSLSDVVSLHTPLTAQTRHLIDAKVLGAAKPGLLLINTARGEIIDLDALFEAMHDGLVGAVGLDVLPEEPANPQHPLIAAWSAGEDWIRHRLLLTPHSAFFTPESMRDMRAKGAEVAARYLRDGVLENCVNDHLIEVRR